MKKIFNLLFHRVVIVGVLILIQFALLFLMIARFNDYFIVFYGISILISMAMVIYIVSSPINPAYKIAWLIPILLIPVFGILLYLLFGRNGLTKKEAAKLKEISQGLQQVSPDTMIPTDELSSLCEDAGIQSSYIRDWAHWSLYKNTSTEYLPMGEAKFERMKAELKKAKHYIFLEYFIISPGVMWNSILEILEEKVAEGVEVRVMYDDLGSCFTLPYNYNKTLEEKGIRCCVFSPFLPVLTARFNNRDHQKICVIDGHTGFTGGINLADEYINAYDKHGHWKDTAIMLKGDGVWSLTSMFLSVWNFSQTTMDDFSQYIPRQEQTPLPVRNGFVQPFNDSPLDRESVGENVYLNLINRARKYVWIFTPYLIITSEMENALCSAAKSGIDVRIVTPHIPDKWYVHMVTRDYYKGLLQSGVKIYEYTPGFIHAKTFLVDDTYGVVGTINLDFRSLYLHFECGVWMYQTSCLNEMKQDYLETIDVSQQITYEQIINAPRRVKLMRRFLRLFAPLL